MDTASARATNATCFGREIAIASWLERHETVNPLALVGLSPNRYPDRIQWVLSVLEN